MKRNKNLQTLSWEHHDGLVIAFRLEQGIKKNVELKIMVDYLLHSWDAALQHHFWQEELILTAPLKQSDTGKKLLLKMTEEHAYLKNLIASMRTNPKNLKVSLAEFHTNLTKHIRFEERQLFPFLEQICSGSDLDKIGEFLHKHHEPGSKKWSPEFWKN